MLYIIMTNNYIKMIIFQEAPPKSFHQKYPQSDLHSQSSTPHFPDQPLPSAHSNLRTDHHVSYNPTQTQSIFNPVPNSAGYNPRTPVNLGYNPGHRPYQNTNQRNNQPNLQPNLQPDNRYDNIESRQQYQQNVNQGLTEKGSFNEPVSGYGMNSFQSGGYNQQSLDDNRQFKNQGPAQHQMSHPQMQQAQMHAPQIRQQELYQQYPRPVLPQMQQEQPAMHQYGDIRFYNPTQNQARQDPSDQIGSVNHPRVSFK